MNKPSVSLINKDGNNSAASTVRNYIGQAIVVKVGDLGIQRLAAYWLAARKCLEASSFTAPPDCERFIVITGRDNIKLSVTIQVSDVRTMRCRAALVDLDWCKSAISLPQQNLHAVRGEAANDEIQCSVMIEIGGLHVPASM